jgi:hypothetical protein
MSKVPRMLVLVSPARELGTWYPEAFYPATTNPRPLEKNLFGYSSQVPDYSPVHDEFEEEVIL